MNHVPLSNQEPADKHMLFDSELTYFIFSGSLLPYLNFICFYWCDCTVSSCVSAAVRILNIKLVTSWKGMCECVSVCGPSFSYLNDFF